MLIDGDAIAESVLAKFDELPSKAKPRQYPDGRREWTPLSGIVLSKGFSSSTQIFSLVIDSLPSRTGMRCLPTAKIPFAKGRCLHDWHAEIVSIRAFNLFLIGECALLANDPCATSPWIRRRTPEELNGEHLAPFTINNDVNIDMYCSDAPCGDASMELVMDSQADSTPWRTREADEGDSTILKGRGHFSELGVVRRKPSRGDAPETKSKSCSDKLALKQATSLLSSISTLLIHPENAYLRSLVIPLSRHNPKSTLRAFSPKGRMSSLVMQDGIEQSWPGGYVFRPFELQTTKKCFLFSRDGVGQNISPSGSNITVMWTLSHVEVLIGGTIQGHKQFSQRGASRLCRAQLWQAALTNCYHDLKTGASLAARRKVKEEAKAVALRGWLPNSGDDDFGL